MSVAVGGAGGPAAAAQANDAPGVAEPLTLVLEEGMVGFKGGERVKAHFWVAVTAGDGHEGGGGAGRRAEGGAEEGGAFWIVQVERGGEVAG